MSCHDIGRGMNEVVKTTIELYDAKAIDINATKKIIASCAAAVNWCDGNEYEATAYIRRCRCGKCLRMVPKGEKLYSVWNVSNNVPDCYNIDKKADIATDGLCSECFDEVISKHQLCSHKSLKYTSTCTTLFTKTKLYIAFCF